MGNTKLKGIIHIGANDGQEARGYFQKNIPVLWIEADPKVFLRLEKTIKDYNNQKALCSLVTDKDDVEYDFLCDQNNCGQSSSVFDFHLHKKMFPKVVMGGNIKLIGKTLPTVLKENNIALEEYAHINMDVEGAELLVLKGAISLYHSDVSSVISSTIFILHPNQCLLVFVVRDKCHPYLFIYFQIIIAIHVKICFPFFQ